MSDRREWRGWYDSLEKPSWTPAGATIGTIWSLLYPIIIVVFGYSVIGVARGSLPASVLVPISLNTVTNVAFTPIQFVLKNLGLAAADILAVLATIVWCMIALWPQAWFASLALLPYLIWVSTATVLQLSISWMNRPKRSYYHS